MRREEAGGRRGRREEAGVRRQGGGGRKEQGGDRGEEARRRRKEETGGRRQEGEDRREEAGENREGSGGRRRRGEEAGRRRQEGVGACFQPGSHVYLQLRSNAPCGAETRWSVCSSVAKGNHNQSQFCPSFPPGPFYLPFSCSTWQQDISKQRVPVETRLWPTCFSITQLSWQSVI